MHIPSYATGTTHRSAMQDTPLVISAIHCNTQEEMASAKIDIGYRDFCAHLLIPLNACRRNNFYLPWRCEHERHAYEKCQYFDYKRRVAKKAQQKQQHQG